MRLLGVDVSAIQGGIDWLNVAARGVRFAYLRCSIGNDSGRDSMFAKNIGGAKAAGLYVGAYHFAYPLPHLDPKEQAEIAFKKAEGLGTALMELPPACDLEWPPPEKWAKWKCEKEQISDWGLGYLEHAEALWGCKPVLYTYPYFAKSVGLADYYSNYPLWIANYSAKGRIPDDKENPIIVKPWISWTLWQHDGDGGLKLPNGVDADFNMFNGDEEALRQFAGQAAVPDLPTLPNLRPSTDYIAEDAIKEYRATRDDG